jgi:hypothetical protein
MAKQTFTTGQVLTAAQMTSLQQTAMGGGSTTAKTTSYTLVAADAGTVVQMNSASATTITVNTALFAAGDTVQIQNIGAGVCTITAGTATVNTAGSLALTQYENGMLYFNTTSAAYFFDVYQSAGGASGLTFINRTTFSASAQVNVDSVFTTTYSAYLVIIETMTAGTGADDAQLLFRRGSTSSTSAIYGVSVGASYNTTPANVGTTNAAQWTMNEYCDGFSATLYFNGVGTGSSVAGRINGTYQASSTGNAGTLGCTIADLQNWNGFALKSSSSTITGAVTTYGLAKS